ncbi:ImcF-related family protein [Paraburkholderia phenazinium]|uniref:Type VI secretion system protein ImpL n=1 Tax=Paraburkholderia phenazinium TaxID=60549 RepID=A0A1G7S9D8_9BURK|nr:ImcF-related family protein [Paraburkholderia phenazinium]SDG19618.1 type VI secretion system protein ImpL [Paraburkholderia phenazinium]
MTDPKLNLRPLDPAHVAESAPSGRLALWGLLVAALIAATVAAGLVWLRGDLFDLAPGEARMRVVIAILIALIVVVAIHLILFFIGAYAVAGRLFRRETGDQTKASKPLKRDARLQRLYEELHIAHGWFWRYRMPWLMVSGSDELIAEVAPGLKQAGVIHVADVILVHAAPDGIDAALWRRQVKQLRSRRPVDSLVQVERTGDGIRPDAERARTLAGIASDLGWAAPVTFLHAVPATGRQPERFDAVGAVVRGSARQSASHAAAGLKDQLTTLEQQTADSGVQLCREPEWITWLVQVSAYIGEQRERIVTGWEALIASKWLRAPLAGVMFAPTFPFAGVVPVPIAADATAPQAPSAAVDGAVAMAAGSATNAGTVVALRVQPASLLPAWQEIGRGVRHHHGRRVGFYWPNALAALMMVAAIGWCAAMTVSFIGNRHLIHDVQASVDATLPAAPGTPAALRAQLALQQEIETLEYRQQHGVPLYLRAGLNHNDEILDSLWQPYQTVAVRNLMQPVVQALEGQLAQLSQVRVDEQQGHDAQQHAYNLLKAYLMLATPSRADASFLKTQLLEVWPAPAGMRAGEWLDTSQQLADFWAEHLRAHPAWRISASMPLVTQMRSTLVNQIGLAGSDDVLYQRVLDAAHGKYADVSLATLLAGADAQGLFTTTQTVPGIFTRAAWEGVIEQAIDDAAKQQHVEGDWVLTDDGPSAQVNATTVQGVIGSARAVLDAKHDTDHLRERLRTRYFSDYTAAWASMLNSFQWIPATSFSGVVDQLTRLTNAQTSPLLAVMKSVQHQGEAGRPLQALTDTLVRKAQGLLGGGDSDQVQALVVNPLDKSFGPLLALLGDASPATGGSQAANGSATNTAAPGGVSLSRVLTADTTVRLKLQQIQSSPDAQSMARALAQAVFQGKLSDLSQARDDAALTAASLGAQWAGFGQTLFVQPLDAAWQAVLQPAAASLNNAWRAGVAAPFQSLFASRYPFSPTTADASFAEFGRYVRPDTGLVNRFIEVELSGVLKRQGDQWVPNELAPQSLQFDPKFLAMLRLIGPMAAHLYVQGEAAYHFELMPLPTPDVTRTELTVDGHQVVYFNQQETWTPLGWPGNGLDSHASLTWQTLNAGLRVAFDATGDWAFLRMLEKAQVKPLDDTRYELVWNAGATGGDTQSTDSTTAPLHYVLRAQAGAGPLDLLKLRGFQMPERIFVTGRAGVLTGLPSLPPLPPEMQP